MKSVICAAVIIVCACIRPGYTLIQNLNSLFSKLQWDLANPKSLGPEGVQIFGLVKCIVVLMKHFVVSN